MERGPPKKRRNCVKNDLEGKEMMIFGSRVTTCYTDFKSIGVRA